MYRNERKEKIVGRPQTTSKSNNTNKLICTHFKKKETFKDKTVH